MTNSSFLIASLISSLIFCLQFGTTFSGCPYSSPSYKTLVSPIYKDFDTSLYTSPINNYTPLVLDLTNPLIWISCSTKHQARSGFVTSTTLTTNSTDGHNPLFPVNVTNVKASCAPKKLLKSLPKDATGIAGLASSNLALSSQLSSLTNMTKQFALCLPGLGRGVAFFGAGPFYFLGIIQPNISSLLKYTPLIKNPLSPSYYINVTGISINTQLLQLPANTFTGGAMLSTVSPYTVLREDIYRPFLSAYDTATKNYARVAPVKPFDLCFNSSKLSSTRMGYGVPGITFTLEGGSYNWTVFGANALVMAAANTACLAFLPNRTIQNVPMVIGGFQMENIFLLFDLENARLGMTGLLFGIMTTCNNFNFTYA